MLSHLVVFAMLIEPLKCNYYSKNGYIVLSCLIINNNENKNDSSSPYLYKKNHADDLRNNFSSSYFYDHNSKWKSINYLHYANVSETKMSWVHKIKKLKFIIHMRFTVSNAK